MEVPIFRKLEKRPRVFGSAPKKTPRGQEAKSRPAWLCLESLARISASHKPPVSEHLWTLDKTKGQAGLSPVGSLSPLSCGKAWNWVEG